MTETLAHVAALLFVPPLLLGVIQRTKALAAGRRGASIWQPYFDIRKLLGKEVALIRTTSWIFVAALGGAALVLFALVWKVVQMMHGVR